MSLNSVNDIVSQLLKDIIEQWEKAGLSPEEIRTKINSFDIGSLMNEVTDVTSKKFASFFKEKMFEIELDERARSSEFLAHQEQVWGKCFAASQTMYTMTVEAANMVFTYINEHVSESKKEELKNTHLALKHIHARACQIFLEILTLLRNGFADCAYARWRSLYELNCIAYFIKTQGEQIAKQYYEQSQTDDQRYKTWTNGAVDKDGSPLVIDHFYKLEKYCEMDDSWNKLYKLACIVTHGSPQGTFKRMSIYKTTDEIPVGRSDYGIALPAVHSAIYLHLISVLYFSVFYNADAIAHIKTLGEWVNVIQDMYYSTEKSAFGEKESEEQ